jgi:hypothetical protein
MYEGAEMGVTKWERTVCECVCVRLRMLHKTLMTPLPLISPSLSPSC